LIIVDTAGLPGGVRTAGDIASLKTWVAERLGIGWKKGYGGLWTSTKVIWVTGQSNAPFEGRATTLPYITPTAPNSYMLGCDSYLRTCFDPCGNNTNNKFSAMSHAGAAGSVIPSMVNAMYGAGIYNGTTEALVIGGWSQGGTTAAQWKVTATPPSAVQLLDVSYLRMIELMRNLPTPELLCHYADQGEDNSVSAPLAAAWSADTTSRFDTIEAMATTQGWAWEKTDLRHFLRVLSDTQVTSPTMTSAAAVQTAQLAFPTGRATGNTIARKAADGNMTAADQVHFNTASWDTWQPGVASDILAAT
jgi:hypothetical protein